MTDPQPETDGQIFRLAVVAEGVVKQGTAPEPPTTNEGERP